MNTKMGGDCDTIGAIAAVGLFME